MARLNIEDQFFLDAFYVAGARLKGNHDILMGNALRFFAHAQKAFADGRVIPEEEYFALGFLEELIPFFAKRVDGGIEAVGAQKHFSWLKDRAEAGRMGGKKSAEARKKKTGTAQPKGGRGSKQNGSTTEAKPKQTPIFTDENCFLPDAPIFDSTEAKTEAPEPSYSYSKNSTKVLFTETPSASVTSIRPKVEFQHPALKMEAGLKQTALDEIQDCLDQAFENLTPPRLRRYRNTILEQFRTVEAFKAWLEGIWNHDKADRSLNPDWIQFLEVCILREIGVIAS